MQKRPQQPPSLALEPPLRSTPAAATTPARVAKAGLANRCNLWAFTTAWIGNFVLQRSAVSPQHIIGRIDDAVVVEVAGNPHRSTADPTRMRSL